MLIKGRGGGVRRIILSPCVVPFRGGGVAYGGASSMGRWVDLGACVCDRDTRLMKEVCRDRVLVGVGESVAKQRVIIINYGPDLGRCRVTFRTAGGATGTGRHVPNSTGEEEG